MEGMHAYGGGDGLPASTPFESVLFAAARATAPASWS
jgi:hypothetical protein